MILILGSFVWAVDPSEPIEFVDLGVPGVAGLLFMEENAELSTVPSTIGNGWAAGRNASAHSLSTKSNGDASSPFLLPSSFASEEMLLFIPAVSDPSFPPTGVEGALPFVLSFANLITILGVLETTGGGDGSSVTLLRLFLSLDIRISRKEEVVDLVPCDTLEMMGGVIPVDTVEGLVLGPVDVLPIGEADEAATVEFLSNSARMAAANFILSAFISPTLSSSWGGDSAKHFLGGFPLVFGLAVSRLLTFPSLLLPPFERSAVSARESLR